MADTIKIGSLDISAFKVGSDDCKIYLGNTKLYPSEEPTPTDNWVLVDKNGFANPRKVKVDYSLIEDDDSEVRDDYNLDSNDSGSYAIMYLNQPTLEWMMQEGYCSDDEIEDLYQKVGLFRGSHGIGIIGILEDGVEYASIGGINLSDFYILPRSSMSNYYLYATQ